MMMTATSRTHEEPESVDKNAKGQEPQPALGPHLRIAPRAMGSARNNLVRGGVGSARGRDQQAYSDLRFDGRRFQCFDPSNAPELRSIEIYKLLTDSRGVLWVGDVEGGLISYQNHRFKFEYSNSAKPLSALENLLSVARTK